LSKYTPVGSASQSVRVAKRSTLDAGLVEARLGVATQMSSP
jgi:hypothetical protein